MMAQIVSGLWKDVQAEVKKVTPVAHYVHCSSHELNLALQAADHIVNS